MLKLDGHIKAFTSRDLTFDSDSYNAFLDIASRYTVDGGLALVLGMPVWTGSLPDGGGELLRATFALSLSTWAHEGERSEARYGLHVARCERRGDFPSWTWVGWKKGAVSFGDGVQEEDGHDAAAEPFG